MLIAASAAAFLLLIAVDRVVAVVRLSEVYRLHSVLPWHHLWSRAILSCRDILPAIDGESEDDPLNREA